MPQIELLFVFVALVALSTSAFAQTDSVRPQIEAAEASVQKAIEAKDYAALEKLWAPNMVVNSPANHVISRSQVFQAIKMDFLVENGYVNRIESFTTYGDVAVVMGNETLTSAPGPQKGKLLHRRYTDIWKRSDGSWVQIARQATYLDAQ